jgi:RimJ/RimL family protein N-acetyltransferase
MIPIPPSTILKGEAVDLLPLQKEHFEELYRAASDKRLWEFIPLDCSVKATFKKAYNAALTERKKGNQLPFVIYHKATDRIIGSTRLFEIFPADRKLEIGWTWIIQEYWGTEINFECKLLLLTFCFETLKAARVQLKTKDNNVRSRTAIEKLGAKFEGILRKDRVQEDGSSRNAAYFSIIDDEWPEAKKKILAQWEERRTAAS